MIYRALTPVKNVSGRGIKRPAQQVDSVNYITFKDTTNWYCLPALKVPILLLLLSLLGHFHLMTSWSWKHQRVGTATCQGSVFYQLAHDALCSEENVCCCVDISCSN